MEFNNIKITKKANIYFDGKVTSRTLITEDGKKVTLGIMLPGEYTFSTGLKEIMEVLQGSMEIKLNTEDTWRTYKENERFEVEANSSFQVKIKEVTDYCCSYIEE